MIRLKSPQLDEMRFAQWIALKNRAEELNQGDLAAAVEEHVIPAAISPPTIAEQMKRLQERLNAIEAKTKLPPVAKRSSKAPTARIERPAAYHLDHFLEFVYSKQTYERVFQPAVGDLRDNQLELLAAGRSAKARWDAWRDCFTIVTMVIGHVPTSWTLKLLAKFKLPV